MPNLLNLKTLKSHNSLRAFTLIEVLVSTALFVVVAVGGLSVLLSSQRAYQRISGNRVAMDNLNLVMDTLTREIKFGSGYGCLNLSSEGNFNREGGPYAFFSSSTLRDDESGLCNAIAFTPQGKNTNKRVYYFNVASSSIHQVDYVLGTGSVFDQVPGSDLTLTGEDFQVGQFWVNVSGISQLDYLEPRVEIYLSGVVEVVRSNTTSQVSTTTIFLQSAVSQRLLDN